MNIVLDCERMKYPNTGLYTFCNKLSHYLKNIIAKEDHLTCYIDPNTGHFMGDATSYIERRLYHKLVPVAVPNLDIWHTSYQVSKYRGGSKHTKNVLTIHDLNFLYEMKDPNAITKSLKKHQKRIDHADHIVTISEYVKKDVLNHLDIKNKPISVIHNGCDLDRYEDFDSPSYKPKKPYIFTIGTTFPKKNFHVLPALLVRNDYELIIAGTLTEYINRIKEEARLLGVENRVKIIGNISNKEKYWYINNCLAFSLPSLAEGFGFPAIEAMLLGKPTFLSTLTSLPEIGGKEANYFDNFDPEHIQQVFEAGMNNYDDNKKNLIMEHASSFNWNNCAQSYYKVYKSLI